MSAPYFAEQHEHLRYQHNYACTARADRLIKLLKDEGHADAAAYIVRSALAEPGDTSLRLRPLAWSRSVAWAEHTICIAGGVVYDPVLAEPTPLEEYPRAMFGEQPVIITPKEQSPE